ncbi:reverse transcriptase-like protein, partial [Candidatus Shapirobacteria bacterium]|nr:reverse transcriptase-like protein [Candidatus Shapirobacteria bacterium]
TGKVLTSFGRYIGRATNNSAEYQAVVEALSFLEKNYLERKAAVVKINFYLDSTLVVNQLNGRFKIKDQKLKNLIIKVKALEEKIKGKIFYHFIPREKNRQADLLVNQTLNQKNF